jgi:hypothetical protein
MSSAMATASTLGPALALALTAALLACGRTPIILPDEGPTVDAEIYALGFCSFKCWRLDQCDLTGGVPKETCEHTCIDDALATLPGDACWAEQIEVRRCLVREAACEGVDDEELPAGAEAVCDHRQQQLDACDS